MTDVFISYSRRDKIYVRRLFDALESQGHDSWVDWESIPYSAEWWREIQTGIEAADTLIFVITPASLGSRICNDEFAYALKLNKRIIPVIRRDIDEREMAGMWFNQLWEQQARANWETLKKINWLFFRRKAECQCEYDDKQEVIAPACDGPDCDYDDFGKAFASLIKTLETDIEHVKMHTRLLVRAQEWESKGRNRSYLLSGDDLHNAEIWLAASGAKEPKPTELHTQYILASRTAATARQRVTIASLVVGLIALAVLALLALIQRNEAVDARATSDFNVTVALVAQATSERRADEARSVALAAAAEQAIEAGRPDIGVALAVEANQVQPPSAQAQRALYAASSALMLRRFEGDIGFENSLAFSPDGQMALSVSVGATLTLWDMTTGDIVRRFERQHTATIWSVVFSPDGQTALSGSSDHTLVLWEVATGEILRRFEGHTGQVNSVVFSPDGQTAISGSCAETNDVATCSRGELILWEVATGGILRRFEGHEGSVNSVAFSPDGQSVLSGACGRLRENQCIRGELILWDMMTGEVVRRFEGHTGKVNSVAFSPDGQMALSGSDDHTLIRWEVATGGILNRFESHEDSVNSVAISPDGRSALSGSWDNTLILWDMATGEALHTLVRQRTRAPISVVFSPDGQTALSGASSESSLILWDMTTGEALRNFEGHTGKVNSVAFSPDGQMALSGSDDRTLILWDVTTGDILRRFEGHEDWVLSVAFSPDGQTALSGSRDDTHILWNVATGEIVRRFVGNTNNVNGVAFSPDGRTALSASEHRILILWEVATGSIVRRFVRHTDLVNSVAFSPDGQTALSGSRDSTVILWDMTTGEVVHHFVGHTGVVNSVAFSPDGQMALSGSDDFSLILWDIATGEVVRRFVGHTGVVNSVAFSPDGQMALSGSGNDGTLILWDVATGAALHRFVGHEDGVTSVAFSPDGQTALSGSRDNTLILWRVLASPGSLLHWVENNRYVPELTCEQRALYGVDVQCDQNGVVSTRTPFPTLVPSPTLRAFTKATRK